MKNRSRTATPTITPALKRLGARQLQRTSPRGDPGKWNLGFEIVGSDTDAPGKGPALVAALRAHFGASFTVTWAGAQYNPIHIAAA